MRRIVFQHRLEGLRAILIPVFQPGRKQIADRVVVGIADILTQSEETLFLTRVVGTLKKVAHRFVRPFAARAQSQKFVLHWGLAIPPFAQRKLIVNQLHMSHLSRWSQFTKVIAEDFEVNLLPNLIGPGIGFLQIAPKMVAVYMIAYGFIILAGQPDSVNSDGAFLRRLMWNVFF